jgi:hypothetical protein
MNRDIAVEFFVPRSRLTPRALAVVLDALVAAGFELESEPGTGVSYGDGLDLFDGASLNDALDHYQRSAAGKLPNDLQRKYGLAWGIVLWKDSGSGRVDVHLGLSAGEPPEHASSGLLRVHLSTRLDRRSSSGPDHDHELAHLPLEFLAWSRLLADLTAPVYGWGGYGGFGLWGETRSIEAAAIAATELPVIEWLNVFGRSYVQRIGLERMLRAPAWRVESLANGSLLVVLGPDPCSVPRDRAKDVARHLGLPAR